MIDPPVAKFASSTQVRLMLVKRLRAPALKLSRWLNGCAANPVRRSDTLRRNCPANVSAALMALASLLQLALFSCWQRSDFRTADRRRRCDDLLVLVLRVPMLIPVTASTYRSDGVCTHLLVSEPGDRTMRFFLLRSPT